MSSTSDVRAILCAADFLLYDFDGPLCDVFSGLSAPSIARRLESIAGRRFDTDDPLVVMHECRLIVERELADIVEDSLIESEVVAIESARANTTGVDSMREALKAGHVIGIVSNNSADAVRRFLYKNDLSQTVSAVVGRHYRRPDLMKPNPWPLARAVELLGASPARTVLVGDSVTDVEACHAGGVGCIALANKPGKREAFTRAGAHVIVDDMAELSHAIRSR